MLNRKTKIVATYGPAIDSDERLAQVIQAGADAIRLNFSYGDHTHHATAIRRIRLVSQQLGQPIAILQDLQGPKIRVGALDPDPMVLEVETEVTLAVAKPTSTRGAIPVEGIPALAADLSIGEEILLKDGTIRLRVVDVGTDSVRCTVTIGGVLSSHQGINFPESPLRTLDAITAKDEADLRFGIKHSVDFVALSFVRAAGDIRRLQRLIQDARADIPVIAKIETGEALRNLEEIVGAADGVMVARGDLGVATDLAEVALWQKEIIRVCNRIGKVVITATQMLESMMIRPIPTRAEVSDVSNAILDGSDAVMLSGETAVGSYPVETVSFMDRIAGRTEARMGPERVVSGQPHLNEVPDAVAHAACVTAHEVGAAAMICVTRSGLTARLVSRYRPRCPVVAVSSEISTIRRLAIVWGVIPVLTDLQPEEEGLITAALGVARDAGLVREGDRVVITAGVSGRTLRGLTNLIRVEVV